MSLWLTIFVSSPYSPVTQIHPSKKMGNNLIKALAEAGYLDTPRRRNLQSVFLLPETQATLQRLGQQELVSILRDNGDRSRA